MHKARAAGAGLTALIAASSAWGATAPAPGKYLAHVVVAEANSALCPNPKGDHFHGILQYRGLNAKQVTLRAPAVYDDTDVIERLTLTITSGVGSPSPSGTFSLLLTPIDLEATGTFDAKLTFSDADAFTARVTVTAPSIGCTEVFRIGLVRSD